MTEREVRKFIENVSPSPGFILDFTKVTLSDFIYELVELELADYSQNGKSNGKRLATLLEQVDSPTATTIVEALITKKENNES